MLGGPKQLRKKIGPVATLQLVTLWLYSSALQNKEYRDLPSIDSVGSYDDTYTCVCEMHSPHLGRQVEELVNDYREICAVFSFVNTIIVLGFMIEVRSPGISLHLWLFDQIECKNLTGITCDSDFGVRLLDGWFAVKEAHRGDLRKLHDLVTLRGSIHIRGEVGNGSWSRNPLDGKFWWPTLGTESCPIRCV
jgi:hypothetical protein